MNKLTRILIGQLQRWRERSFRTRLGRLGVGRGRESLRLCGQAPTLDVTGSIEFGAEVTIRCIDRPITIKVGPGARLSVGACSYLNQGSNFAVTREVAIGERCLVAENVSFFDTNYHEVDQGEGVQTEPITIGRNVWIGHGAVILPGTRLGDHSVVAAGAVVRGVFPDRSLVGGVPARLIRAVRCSDDFRRS